MRAKPRTSNRCHVNIKEPRSAARILRWTPENSTLHPSFLFFFSLFFLLGQITQASHDAYQNLPMRWLARPSAQSQTSVPAGDDALTRDGSWPRGHRRPLGSSSLIGCLPPGLFVCLPFWTNRLWKLNIKYKDIKWNKTVFLFIFCMFILFFFTLNEDKRISISISVISLSWNPLTAFYLCGE